ncbi:MAG: hypothetical protein KDD11_10965 [Acidobacteria bacterium]|nr:hypothetical protein [Acidobacteriota bacterium]
MIRRRSTARLGALACVVGLAGLALVACEAQREGPAAEAPRFEVEVASGAAALGEPVEVTLRLTGARGRQTLFPTWHERWGDATILTAGPVEHQDDETGTETRQIVRVAAYRPGTVELPPVAVHWADETLLSRPQRFEVVFSLTPDELAEGPRPPAPPHRLPPLSPWWSVSGGALALALALIFERRRPPTTAVQPRGSLDATSELLAGLADLERQRPDPVLFHTRLSLGLRRFVGRSVGFDGETATAPGLRRRLDGLDLPRALSSRTGDLLAECDAVRFGGRPASAQDMGRRLATARGLARGWPQRATAAAHRAPRSNQEAES